MEIGVMYYDGSNVNIVDKIEEFCKWYEKKHKIKPESCYINIDDYNKNEEEIKNVSFVEVQPMHRILKNYFWIGCEDMTFQDYSDLNLKNEE